MMNVTVILDMLQETLQLTLNYSIQQQIFTAEPGSGSV